MDSRVLVIGDRPLSAASIVLMPLAILSISALRSPARLFRAEAVKKLVGLSKAEFTLFPVARRSCVFAIRSAVPWSDSRLARTALESEMSDMDLPHPERPTNAVFSKNPFTEVNVNDELTMRLNTCET